MRESKNGRLISVPAMLIVAVAAASLTWLCVAWIGDRGPFAAAATVILAELFLACCGAAALLLTARLLEAYLRSESHAEERSSRPQRPGWWRRYWQSTRRSESQTPPASFAPVSVDHWLQSVYNEMRPVEAANTAPVTLPFPSRPASRQPLRRFETDTDRDQRRAA